MKTSLILIQLITFTTYVIYVSRYKPYSISQSWYILQEDNKGWMFTLFTWMIGLPVLFYGNVLFFLAGSFMCFVGVATRYKDKFEGWVHNLATIVSILLAFAGTIYEGSWSGLYFFLLAIISIILFKINRSTWWVEIAAFFCIMISIYFM